MAALQWGNELRAALVLGDYTVNRAPGGNSTPLVIPISHPDPGNNIGINRVNARIHILTQPSGLYSTALILFRTSDNILLGGAITDTRTTANPLEITRSATLDDRLLVFDPNFYRLNSGDSLYAAFTTYGAGTFAGQQPADNSFRASLDILIGWYRGV